MSSCLVIGGAGFIGSHLVEALLAHGHQVAVLDNLATGNLQNLHKVRHDIHFIQGNLADEALLKDAVQDVAVIFDLASASDNPGADGKFSETPPLLNAACNAAVRRVVFASSHRVYGRCGTDRFREVDAVLPESAAGFAKLAAELHCIRFTYLNGLETIRLRLASVFGPRQSPASPYAQTMSTLVKAMLAGQTPVLDQSEGIPEDYLYIDDAIQAILLAAETPRISGQVFNIGRGRLTHPLLVAAAINEILGTRIELMAPPLEIDDKTPAMNVARAEVELGFCPSIDLRLGLIMLIEHYLHPGGHRLEDSWPDHVSKYFLNQGRPKLTPSDEDHPN